MSSAIINQIASGKSNSSSPHINAWGKYRFRVERLFAFKGIEKPWFIAEFTVLSMTPTLPPDQLAKIPLHEQPNAVGTIACLKVDMSQLSAPGNVLGFVMALYNVPESEVTGPEGRAALEEMIETTDSQGNPLKDSQGREIIHRQPAHGLEILDETYSKPQKKNKDKSWTHHRWVHVPRDAGQSRLMKSPLQRVNPGKDIPF